MTIDHKVTEDTQKRKRELGDLCDLVVNPTVMKEYSTVLPEVEYQYDSLNRLISATETGGDWGLSFGYDGFGNRVSQTGARTHEVVVDPATNRISGSGYVYDANGNMTAMPGGRTMVWDALNRVT